MATAALTSSDIRIVPLAEADISGLDILFEEQCSEWMVRLNWDYRGPTGLLRDVARERQLAGFAAVAGRATVGFAFYVVEGTRCAIGDIFVSPGWREQGIDRQIARAMISEFDRIPGLSRIESQGVSFGNAGVSEIFKSYGFKQVVRHFMTMKLASLPKSSRWASPSNEDAHIRSWKDDDFGRVARIIHGSYHSEDDSLFNSQYRTEAGCAELLSVLIDSVWCGDFLPEVSRVATSRRGVQPVGALIASQISAGVGHIGQISILPTYQNKGLGRRMMYSALSRFADHHISTVTLAVTETNIRAVHLYESIGFSSVHGFPVYYWERNPGGNRPGAWTPTPTDSDIPPSDS